MSNLRKLALGIALALPLCAAHAQTVVVVSSCGAQSLSLGLGYNIYMDQTGKVCDAGGGSGGGGGTSATFGNTFPTTGTPAGGSDGTNFQPLVVDPTTHYLQVDIKAGAGSGGTALGDEGAFTAGSTNLTPAGGLYQTTATSNPLTNGQAGSVQITANRAFMVNLRNASGAELGLSAAPLQMGLASGNVASGAYASGAFATGSGTDGWNVTEGAKADAAWSSGNGSIIAILKAISGSATTTATNTGAAVPAGSAIIGKVGVDQTTPGTTNGISLVGVNAATALAGAGAVGTGAQRIAVGQDATTIAGMAPGTVTAGAAPANMAMTGCQYNATNPAATDTQALAMQCDAAGRLRVNAQPATQNAVSGTANTTGTSTTSLIGAVTSNRIYVSAFSCANTGASASLISFQDGSGGTTLWTTIVPAGGGSNLSGNTALFKTTSGNAVYFAAATASTTIYCSGAGYSGP